MFGGVIAYLLAGSGGVLTESHVKGHAKDMWAAFKVAQRRNYTQAEEHERFGYFYENMLRAAKSQRLNPKATFGPGPFSDLSQAEFKAYHFRRKRVRPRSPERLYTAEEIASRAESMDWRKEGALTKVKHQSANITDLDSDEEVMATWLSDNGPLPVSVDTSIWQDYTGGIVSDCNKDDVDHAVLAVGYTPDYWILKNSWGSDWGEEGYIRLKFGTNQCGIREEPVVPLADTTRSALGVIKWQRSNLTSMTTASFTQEECSDSACSHDCTSHSFEIGKCLVPQEGPASAIVESCNTATGMVMKSWLVSKTCEGPLYLTTQQAVDRCLEDVGGTYVKNSCSSLGSPYTDGAKLAIVPQGK